ncbi:MAG: PAS domain-containing protein, partial [Gammaproteobacteria bacterium]|nr:PAS domain-containing protein [Gammaproteobacteria bacterium]
MHKKNETIHLLILDPSQNEAEKLVSLLRNSGRATRAHRVTSEEDLLESLSGGTWDLFLARDTAESPTPAEALAHLNRLSKDIPLILLSEQPDREKQVAALRQGARAVIVAEHTDLLMLAITRELENLSERRRRRTLENHLRESEQRCQLLLESSRDAIAYVNDGMHIYANRSYLDFFGYDDVDDLMCIPILDTLLPEDQDDFKDFMKRFAEQPQGNATLTCTGVRSDENQLKIIMSVSSATYEGEPCVQVVVRPEHNNAELEEKLRQISSQDLITGL